MQSRIHLVGVWNCNDSFISYKLRNANKFREPIVENLIKHGQQAYQMHINM